MKYNDVSMAAEIIAEMRELTAVDQAVCYTSLDGALGIFKNYSKKNELSFWATNCRFSNDKNEYLTGYNILTEKDKKKIVGMYSDAYVLCFCENPDLLSQWNRYGSNSGISIKLDFTKLKTIFWESSSEPRSSGLLDIDDYHLAGYKPRGVKYSIDEVKSIIENEDKIYGDTEKGRLRLNVLLPFIKDAAFTDEQESRLLFWPVVDNENQLLTNVKYRILRNLIAPYIEAKFTPINKDDNPISGIVVGPGANQNEVFNALIHMLETDRDSYAYIDDPAIKLYTTKKSKITIRKSEIPFRS